jgi:hypothetical protein
VAEHLDAIGVRQLAIEQQQIDAGQGCERGSTGRSLDHRMTVLLEPLAQVGSDQHIILDD